MLRVRYTFIDMLLLEMHDHVGPRNWHSTNCAAAFPFWKLDTTLDSCNLNLSEVINVHAYRAFGYVFFRHFLLLYTSNISDC